MATKIESAAAPVASAEQASPEARIARVILASEAITFLEKKWTASSTRAKAFGRAAKALDAALARIGAKFRREASAIERGLAELRRGELAERANRVLSASAQGAERATRLVDAIVKEIDAPGASGGRAAPPPIF